MKQNQVFRQYVLAGNRLMQNERINVSAHVQVENHGDQDQRDRFVAPAGKAAVPTISLKFSILMLLLAVLLAFFMVNGQSNLTHTLEEEYASLGMRFNTAQQEATRLGQELDKKSDASLICYYAVQSLGMHLAGNQETIAITAVRHQTVQPEGMRGLANGAH